MRKIHFTNALVFAGVLITSHAFAADIDLSKLPPASTQKDVTFEKDIKPIFKESCVRCHGAERPKAGLRLDNLEGALKGGKDGKVIVPGDSAKSDIVISVARIDPETAMPPTRQRGGRRGGPGGNRPPMGESATNQPPAGGPPPMQGPPAKPLTPEQVGLVRAWIDQGAK